MDMPSPSAQNPAAMERGGRLQSLDFVRGADVWLMLFVNEMAGVRDTPAFLLHVPPSADGMTITDVVFPAFLFITGMAIPRSRSAAGSAAASLAPACGGTCSRGRRRCW